LCSLFSITNNNKPEFNLASECRNNPFLCGTNPWFYSSKNSKQIESNIDKTVINKDKNIFDIFTKSEMQQIEKEAYKKYSENTEKDLYKLFRKK
jgi:hypothetical protein